jgi:hypothetical protein
MTDTQFYLTGVPTSAALISMLVNGLLFMAMNSLKS